MEIKVILGIHDVDEGDYMNIQDVVDGVFIDALILKYSIDIITPFCNVPKISKWVKSFNFHVLKD